MNAGVKQAINRCTVDNAISSGLDRLIYAQVSAQNTVCYIMKTPTLTDIINRLVKRHAEIAAINKAKFYDRATNVREENDKGTLSSSPMGNFFASPSISLQDENK